MEEKEQIKKDTDDRGQGDHLPRGFVKAEIIKYILSKDGPVPGPDIREYLKKNLNLKNQKNIKDHLEKLRKDHYIEKIPFEKEGYENKWDVKKKENLLNIQTGFTDIQLNNYGKCLDTYLEELVCKKCFSSVLSPQAKELRVQLDISAALFNFCLNNDIKTLYEYADEIYSQGESFDYFNHIQSSTTEFCTRCASQFSVSPNIWLSAYNENVKDSSKLEFYQNPLQSFPNAELSEETFRNVFDETDLFGRNILEWKARFEKEFAIKMANAISQKILSETPAESENPREEILETVCKSILNKVLDEIQVIKKEMPGEEWKFLYIEELSMKISYEIFQKMLKNFPVEFLNISDEEISIVWTEIFKKILQEVLKKMVEMPEEMYRILYEVKLYWHVRQIKSHRILFEHFYHRDIIDKTVSSDEKEFLALMNNLEADHSINREKAIDEFSRDYYKRHKEKTGIPQYLNP